MCQGIIDGNSVDIEDFRKVVEFGRNYADKYHHGKEEKILFPKMEESIGELAKKLIRQGMLVEHDLGRLHTMQLIEALDKYEETKNDVYKLDIIMNATAYGDLLKRHIDKENNTVFTFAERHLKEDEKKSVDLSTEDFEENVANMEEINGYLVNLAYLMKKYY